MVKCANYMLVLYYIYGQSFLVMEMYILNAFML